MQQFENLIIYQSKKEKFSDSQTRKLSDQILGAGSLLEVYAERSRSVAIFFATLFVRLRFSKPKQKRISTAKQSLDESNKKIKILSQSELRI